MGKQLNTFDVWNGIESESRFPVERLSRWITVKHAYDITPRHSLYDFCTDENGYRPWQLEFNPVNGTYLDYFEWKGEKYAIAQFICYGGMAEFGHFHGYIENGEKHYFAGYDSMTIFDSMLSETDKYLERVRVYM